MNVEALIECIRKEMDRQASAGYGLFLSEDLDRESASVDGTVDYRELAEAIMKEFGSKA